MECITRNSKATVEIPCLRQRHAMRQITPEQVGGRTEIEALKCYRKPFNGMYRNTKVQRLKLLAYSKRCENNFGRCKAKAGKIDEAESV